MYKRVRVLYVSIQRKHTGPYIVPYAHVQNLCVPYVHIRATYTKLIQVVYNPFFTGENVDSTLNPRNAREREKRAEITSIPRVFHFDVVNKVKCIRITLRTVQLSN
jgi:hypothetical protein